MFSIFITHGRLICCTFLEHELGPVGISHIVRNIHFDDPRLKVGESFREGAPNTRGLANEQLRAWMMHVCRCGILEYRKFTNIPYV